MFGKVEFDQIGDLQGDQTRPPGGFAKVTRRNSSKQGERKEF
jgi:hypothetical protein